MRRRGKVALCYERTPAKAPRTMLRSLACPTCRSALVYDGPDRLRCGLCERTLSREAGIWRMFAAGRAEVLSTFVARYEAVRAREGRVVPDQRHLRALPFRDLSGRRKAEWAIRASSFRSLMREVVLPLERSYKRPLDVADLGSGVGWLAYRLGIRGHRVAAVDVVTNDVDGLGALSLYLRDGLALEAEFDHLPLRESSLDLVVYNASLHYAGDYRVTLTEALRVLRPFGRLVIMDSPVYEDEASGRAMVQERESALQTRPGGASVHTEGFLTEKRLSALGEALGLTWRVLTPWYGLRWWVRPKVSRVLGRREPARFKLIVGQRR